MSDRLSEIEGRLAGATPGVWKLWGMAVLADQDGTSNVDTAVPVAMTQMLIDGKPRTFDADLIAHAPADLAALVAVVREVEALHQPNDAPSFTESSYGIAGQIPGTVTLSGFTSRDVTCCKNCGAEYPCPTAQALQRLGGTS